MNKMMKKIMAILAVFAMVVTMLPAVGAKAAATIDYTKKGSITVNKQSKDTNDNTAALDGVGFTLYKIATLNNNGSYTMDVTAGNYTEAKQLLNLSVEAQEAAAFAFADAVTDANKVATEETKDGGKAVFSNLTLGYYLVVETSPASGYVAAMPFFVAVPSSNNLASKGGTPAGEATDWIYDISATPKNKKTDVTKALTNGPTVDGNVEVGQDVPYTLTTTSPAYTADYFKGDRKPVYKITDTLSKGLEFNNDVVVTLGTTTLKEKTDYTVTENGNSFVVDFTESFLKNKDYQNKIITITYTAKITQQAVVGSTGNANDVKLDYTNKPGVNTSTEKIEVKVYTYGIKLTKQGENKDTLLDGVTFKLEKKEGENYVAVTGLKGMTDGPLTTSNGGTLNIEGLDADVEYRLTETKTANGYTLLKNPIVINLTGSEGTLSKATATCGGEDITMGIDANAGYATITVTNNKGFTLPETGGMGTYLFTIGGIVIMAGAAFALFAMKKKSK